jgi:uncharacterized membrane protein
MLFYPFIVYFGVSVGSFHVVACLIGIVLIGNFITQNWRVFQTRFLISFLAIILTYTFGTLLHSSRSILYLPSSISAILLISFAYSLIFPPNMIEAFARRVVLDLSSDEIVYCRRITQIWVGFLTINGLLAYYTACCTSLGIWSLYNGFITYAAMGLLFAVELSYRSWRFRRYAGLPTDFIFKRLFPPKA